MDNIDMTFLDYLGHALPAAGTYAVALVFIVWVFTKVIS
jgi:hypothetical protein